MILGGGGGGGGNPPFPRVLYETLLCVYLTSLVLHVFIRNNFLNLK